MCVVTDEPDLGLEAAVSSKTFQMRLRVIQVDAQKETVVTGKANSMKEELDTKVELTVVQYKGATRLRECCRQCQAEVVSNSRDKTHQTWGPLFSPPSD